MKHAPLEPGILNIFRSYLAIQFLFILVTVLAHSGRGLVTRDPCFVTIMAGIFTALVMGYLSWPFLQRRLGVFYFPLALAAVTVFSLVMQNLFLDVRLSSLAGSSEERAWQLFLFLFIPMLMVAWQYHLKAVLAYCLLTAFLDVALMRLARPDFLLIADTFVRLTMIRTLAFLIAGHVIVKIMRQLRAQRAALHQANRELAQFAATQEQLTLSRERNRMARELHDTLAHTLTGIAVQLEAVESLWKGYPDDAHAMLGKSLAATRAGITETRRTLQALRASPLEDMGLGLALRSLAAAAAERAGLQLDLQVPEALPKLPPDVEQGIYRVAQEGFENIVRHARACTLRAHCTVADGWLRLCIADDGCGFTPAEPGDDAHYGLRGMQERARMMGAELAIESRAGQGTTIRLKVKV